MLAIIQVINPVTMVHCNTTCMCAVTVHYVTQVFSTRMKVFVLIVAACFLAVVVKQTYGEEKENFDMSTVRVARRVTCTYTVGHCNSRLYRYGLTNLNLYYNIMLSNQVLKGIYVV